MGLNERTILCETSKCNILQVRLESVNVNLRWCAILSQCVPVFAALLRLGHTSLLTRSRSILAILRQSSLPRRFWKEKGAGMGTRGSIWLQHTRFPSKLFVWVLPYPKQS